MLIGLVGYKGSGKSVVANALIAHKGFERVKMAGALKEMVAALLRYQGVPGDFIDRMIEGDLKELPAPALGGRTPRYVMQTLGTEWGRNIIGQNFWISTFLRAALDREVVCDDVRFNNEADAIRSLGGRLVRIVRPGNVIDTSHPSEREIGEIKCDVTIVNDKDVQHLHHMALVVADELRAIA